MPGFTVKGVQLVQNTNLDIIQLVVQYGIMGDIMMDLRYSKHQFSEVPVGTDTCFWNGSFTTLAVEMNQFVALGSRTIVLAYRA